MLPAAWRLTGNETTGASPASQSGMASEYAPKHDGRNVGRRGIPRVPPDRRPVILIFPRSMSSLAGCDELRQFGSRLPNFVSGNALYRRLNATAGNMHAASFASRDGFSSPLLRRILCGRWGKFTELGRTR